MIAMYVLYEAPRSYREEIRCLGTVAAIYYRGLLSVSLNLYLILTSRERDRKRQREIVKEDKEKKST